MKICFVTTNFPRFLGDGEGNFIWAAARAVAEQGHQVKVVAQHWPHLPAHEWMENIEVIRPPYWWPEAKEVLRREIGGLPVSWRGSWLARWQIPAFILVHTLAVARHAADCDIIHAQWTLSAGAALLSRLVHRRPVVVTLHGSDIFQVTRHWLGQKLTVQILKRCAGIIAVSQALANATTTAVGVAPEAIRVIPDGVDVSQFKPGSDHREPLILYVGSLIKRKGVIYLLQAMAKIVTDYPAVTLIIVGDGPERPALEQLAQTLNLTGKVIFTGLLPSAQVREWLQRARLFVLPSVEEGLGVVLLEALACGTPIVASRVGGIPEVVTPPVGRLVPPANATALAQAIDHLLGHDQTWQMMSQHARLRAETCYDWTRIGQQLIQIYEETLNR